MPEPLISIIIPIYNVEQYLAECLSSVINQTFRNLEIICVNDGSLDDSAKIVEDFKREDRRVQLINKTNGGLSDARNAGIKRATGRYLFFLDSDDVLDLTCIEQLNKLREKTSSQIVSCDYQRFSSTKFEMEIDASNAVIIADHAYAVYKKGYYDPHFKTVLNIACAKLYDRSLFNRIRYPLNKLNEDEHTTYKLYALASKACHVSLPLYGYRMREGSITQSTIPESTKIDLLNAYENRISTFSSKNDKVLNCFTVDDYLFNILSLCLTTPSEKTQSLLLKKYKTAYSQYKECLTVTLRIKRLAFYYFPSLYGFISKIANRFMH